MYYYKKKTKRNLLAFFMLHFLFIDPFRYSFTLSVIFGHIFGLPDFPPPTCGSGSASLPRSQYCSLCLGAVSAARTS